MQGIDKFAVAAGIVLLVGGSILAIISVFSPFFLLIYAIPAIIIGLVILLTLRKQEYVEPIKSETNKKQRK
ncbi:hypothetical protein CMI47_22200 [Candidatus Pacearchaeota archaeon]|nr:hypothetical protein [Candidatus Pacearchaeota archaeon]|tara:strand:+ start:20859 stop:21071 length:213 start_codon:yes stop_codon:yes gene_type:complete